MFAMELSPVMIIPTKSKQDFVVPFWNNTHFCRLTDMFLARTFHLGLIYTMNMIIKNNLTVENQVQFQGDLVNTKIIDTNLKTVPSPL